MNSDGTAKRVLIGCLGFALLAALCWVVLFPPTSYKIRQFLHDLNAPPAITPNIQALPFPEYPGARLIRVTGDVTGTWGLGRTYLTDANPDDVLRFYKEQLPVTGWEEHVGGNTLNYIRTGWYRLFITLRPRESGGEWEIYSGISFDPSPEIPTAPPPSMPPDTGFPTPQGMSIQTSP